MRRLVALLLLVASAACTSSSRPRDVTWTVELSTAPTLLALGPSDVWAASFGNGVGGSQVYRVDRDTGRRAAQHTLAGQPNGLVVAPDGALWLSTVTLPDQPSGTGLQVLDPRSLSTRRAVLLPLVPLGLAFVDGALWVGASDGVRRLDGSALGALVPTPEPALRLLAVGDRLLAVGAGSLTLLDPTGDRPPVVRRVPSSGSLSVTAADDLLWVLAPDATATSLLQRYDSRTLVPLDRAPSPGPAGAVAALGGTALWVTDPSGDRLLCAERRRGTVRGSRSLDVSGPLVVDQDAVVTATPTGLRSVAPDC